MMLRVARMKKTKSAPWLMLAALSAAACASTVESMETGGTTSSTSSSSSSSSSGSGGGCSVSLPAGCGCPDPGGAWSHGFSTAGSDKETDFLTLGALPIAPDGSTMLNVRTSQINPNISKTLSSRLVKLDAAGHVLWDQLAVETLTATPDPRDCSTLVAGTIGTGSTELLGQMVTCSSSGCQFVARIDAGGSLEWIKVYDFGADGLPFPSIAGILADGRIALFGPFLGTVDLGNGPLSVPGPHASGVFVALLSPTGDALWSRHFTKVAAPTPTVFAVAVVSPAGNITVATRPDGDVDFGDGPDASGLGGLALASYDPTGALRFGKVIAPCPRGSPSPCSP